MKYLAVLSLLFPLAASAEQIICNPSHPRYKECVKMREEIEWAKTKEKISQREYERQRRCLYYPNTPGCPKR